MRDGAALFRRLGGRRVSKTILALDLGSLTGWAMRLDSGAIASGTVDLRPGRYHGGGMRYVRFAQWLDTLPRPDVVYFEEVRRHLGVDAAHIYGGLLAHLTAWAEVNKIPYQGVPVGAIKKHIAGKGNADKVAVIEAIRRLGFSPADSNEADALALLDWAIAQESCGARR